MQPHLNPQQGFGDLGGNLPARGRMSVEVNLDEVARQWKRAHPELWQHETNPLLDPLKCQRMIDELHAKLGVAWSYGGYLEDRSFLWKGSYLEANKSFIHAGIDINKPAGTPVALGIPGRVLLVDSDYPESLGWGVRVVVAPGISMEKPCVLMLAHLQNVTCKVGDLLRARQQIAEIGDWREALFDGKPANNGGWFQHLHVQAIHADFFRGCCEGGSLDAIDGYFPKRHLAQSRSIYFNPERYLKGLL